jgi:hypothetical protein
LLLVWDGQDSLDQSGVVRNFQCRIAKERPNRRQAQVSAPCSIGAVILQVIQECPEEWGIQVFHRQLRRWFVQPFLSELQQQAEGIPIGNDSMWARPSLSNETLCKE